MEAEQLALQIVTEGLRKFTADMGKADGVVAGSASGWQKASGVVGKAAGAAFSIVSTTALAAGAAAIGLGVAIGKMTLDAAAVEGVSNTFAKLAQSVGGDATLAMEQLRVATRGMVADADLMQAGNKFLAMGLADSTEEAAKLAEVATQLGLAMGEDATSSMENFALMMANQSIPRLDSFGISSGIVRVRIKELMAETQGLTREQAFNTAVLEQAALTMAKVGEQSGTAGASMATIRAQIQNITLQIGQAFLPALSALLKPLARLIQEHGPQLVAVFGKVAAAIVPIVEEFANFLGRLLDGEDPLTAFRVLLMKLVPPELFPRVMEIVDAIVDGIDILTDVIAAFTSGTPGDFPWEDVLSPEMAEVAYTIAAGIENLLEGIEQARGVLESGQGVFAAFVEVLDNFLSDETIEQIWEFRDAMQEAGELIVTVWQNNVVPALDNVWEIIKATVAGAVQVILSTIMLFMQVLSGDWESAWQSVQDIAAEIWDTVGTVFAEFLEGVLNVMGTNTDEFVAVWRNNLQMLQEVASQIWDKISATFTDILTTISDFVQETIDAIANHWTVGDQSIWQDISTIWGAILDVISGIMQAIAVVVAVVLDATFSRWVDALKALLFVAQVWWDSFGEFWRQVYAGLVEIVKTALATIAAIFTTNLSTIWQIVSNAFTLITTLIGNALQQWRLIISAIAALIRGDTDQFMDSMGKFIALGWENIKLITATAWENVRLAIGAAWENIKLLVSQGLKNIKTAFTSINWSEVGKSIIAGIASGISSAAGRMADAAAKAVRDALSAAKRAITGGGSSGGGSGGGGGAYQHGGTTAGGDMLVGERGPELLTGVPGGAQVLSAPTTARMTGGSSITNNYNLTTNSLTRPSGLRLEFSAMAMGSR